jgi:hypothetical protein
VYPIILEGVRNHELMYEIWQRLEFAKEGAVSQEKLTRFIESARIAQQRVRNIGYIVKRSEKGPIIEIVDYQIAGRCSTGCR